jgi:hypothetical protein
MTSTPSQESTQVIEEGEKKGSELSKMDRSVCHQRREYKSPYDWCQLIYHHESLEWRRENQEHKNSRGNSPFQEYTAIK